MTSQAGKAHFWAMCGLANLALALSSVAALAQGLDCSRLQAQIASVRGDPAKAQRFAGAARRQSQELGRTISYARSIGCENHQFLFFGSPPPPQCPQINVRIQRMQANLQHLEQEAAVAGGEAQRRALTERYNSYCQRGAQASLQRPRSFFQQLFGGGEPSQPPAEIPVNPDRAANGSGDQTAHGGSKAVCVRTTDGSFFPVSYTATRSKLPALQKQCQALCPNVKTELFTYPGAGVIDQAVSIDGKPYSSLPNAGLFRTQYDPASTCRPPDESWAQAMAGAERLIGERRSDIIVTPEKSKELSQPGLVPTASKGGKGNARAQSATQAGADQLADESANVPEGSAGDAQSADIGGAAIKGKFYGEKAGQVKEEIGPNGVKQRVRIVGPKF